MEHSDSPERPPSLELSRPASLGPCRRKYTVTAKVLAAAWANLAKANAVPKEIRFRTTEKRRLACRANLLKALEQDRALGENSLAYGTGFRHGLYCFSLERSLRLAGESREEFEAHRERCARAFAPRDAGEERLVRGIAEASWRRLRVFRGRARWEEHALEWRLARAAQDRAAGVLPWLGAAECDWRLALEIRRILGLEFSLEQLLDRMNPRLERLLRIYAQGREPEVTPFQRLTFPRAGESRLVMEPLEAMNNPLLGPGRVAAWLRPKPLEVRPVTEWREGPAPERRSSLDPYGERLVDGLARELRYGLMRRVLWETPGAAASAGGEGASATGASENGPPGERNRQDFLRRFARAFGLETENGAADPLGAPQGPDQPAAAPHLAAAEVRAAAERAWARLEVYRARAREEADGFEQILERAAENRQRAAASSLVDERSAPEPAVEPALEPAVEPALEPAVEKDPPWGESPERWAEWVASFRRMREAPAPRHPEHDLAEEILELFTGYPKAINRAYLRARRLDRAFYALLVARHGPQPKFATLRMGYRRGKAEAPKAEARKAGGEASPNEAPGVRKTEFADLPPPRKKAS